MRVGIVGLGLIGGSFAKAYKRFEGINVLAYDTNEDVLHEAMGDGNVDDVLTMDNIKYLDLLLLASYPEGAKQYLEAAAPNISSKTLVMDALGTKRGICEAAFPLADKYGFTFVGGHPMAGTHNSGYAYSRADMFDGSPMVLVPPAIYDLELIDRIKEMLAPVGFGYFSLTSAQKHDEMIAFTSQLAHVVSNAYIKSPTAARHKGFSAGSYKDLTRVAWLNPDMWAELFMENGDCLCNEIDTIIDNLQQYSDAIKAGDRARLTQLLDDGRNRKKEIDG